MSIPQVYLYNSFSEWVTVNNQVANNVGDLSLFTGNNIGGVSLVAATNNLDTIKYMKSGGAITGWCTVSSTLGVSGATSLSSTLNVSGATTLTGLLTANSNIILGSNVITLNSTSGNALISGSMAIAGATSLSSTLSVSNATSLSSTLSVAGITTLSNALNVSGTTTLSGAATVSLGLSVNGNFNVNSSAFTVNATNGNTAIGGTLYVTGNTTFNGNMSSTYGVITTSNPFFTASQGWNNASTIFTGILVNITNTASNVNSLLMDFQQNNITTFGVTAGGTINQVTTSSNLARSIISNVTELRTIREYQDLNDGGYQGLDIGSVTEFGTSYNAYWSPSSSTFLKDRALANDSASYSRLTEDFKYQWWYSNGTTASSPIVWSKFIEFNLPASTVTLNGAVSANSLSTSALIATGSVTLGTASLFADFIVTTATVSNTILSSVSATSYRSGEYYIQAFDATSGKYHVTTMSFVHNGTVASYVEYGSVAVVGVCGLYSIAISGGNVVLTVTPASANSTTFKVHSTLINI